MKKILFILFICFLYCLGFTENNKTIEQEQNNSLLNELKGLWHEVSMYDEEQNKSIIYNTTKLYLIFIDNYIITFADDEDGERIQKYKYSIKEYKEFIEINNHKCITILFKETNDKYIFEIIKPYFIKLSVYTDKNRIRASYILYNYKKRNEISRSDSME